MYACQQCHPENFVVEGPGGNFVVLVGRRGIQFCQRLRFLDCRPFLVRRLAFACFPDAGDGAAFSSKEAFDVLGSVLVPS